MTAGVAAAGLRGHPRHPPRARERGRARHRPRGPRRRPRRALDWPALAAFPGTLVFYMGVRQLPQIARVADRRPGAPAAEPAAVVERGHAARPAHGHGHARDDRRGRASASRSRPPVDHGRRARSRRSPSELAWLRAGAARRAHRGGHARARAGERAGAAAAARSGARVVAGAGDPHRSRCRAPPLDPSPYDLSA